MIFFIAAMGLVMSVCHGETIGLRESTSSGETIGLRESTSSGETIGLRESTSSGETIGLRESTSSGETIGLRESTSLDATIGERESISLDATIGERESTSLDATIGERESTSLRSTKLSLDAVQPEGIFDCDLPPASGTLNFVQGTNTFHLNMTIMECDFKVADVPYTATPTEKWATTMIANYTGTTLDDQVRYCNKPQFIDALDFERMTYLHEKAYEVIWMLSKSGYWQGSFTKRP